MVRYLGPLRKLVEVIVQTLPSLAWIILLLSLCTFVFSIMGMQFFGSQNESRVLCLEFNSFGMAFLTMFMLLTEEDAFNRFTYPCSLATSSFAIVFFVCWILIAVFILLDLILVVILERFGQKDEEILASNTNDKDCGSGEIEIKAEKENLPLTSHTESAVMLIPKGRSLFCFSEDSPVRKRVFALVTHQMFDTVILFLICVSSLAMACEHPFIEKNTLLFYVLRSVDYVLTVAFTLELVVKFVAFGVFEYMKDRWNQLDAFIVLVSLLALYPSGSTDLGFLKGLRLLRSLRPLRVIKRNPGLRIAVNALFKSLFAMANIVGLILMLWTVFIIMGTMAWSGRFSFCTDVLAQPPPWDAGTTPVAIGNQLDDMDAEMVSATDAGRRSFAGYGIATVDASLLTTREQCDGSFFSTWEYETMLQGNSSNPQGAREQLLLVERQHPRVWLSHPLNYDNFFQGLLTVFAVTTTDGWVDVAACAAAAPENSSLPNPAAAARYAGFLKSEHDYNDTLVYAYFVAFLTVSTFFFMKLFVGVVYTNFHTLKLAQDGSCFLTPTQKTWVDAQRALFRHKPKTVVRPASENNRIRMLAFRLTMRSEFETAVMACIVANLLSMALVHYPEAKWSETLQDVLEVLFALLFAVEALIKITGLGNAFYFFGPERRWNRFDFMLVIASGVDLLLKYGITAAPVVSMLLALMRIFRVGRAVRLIKRAKSLNQLFVTLIYSIPSIVNIVLMLCLFLFIFAVLAMDLFGRAPRDGVWITDQANFATFGVSILTMFRIITGDEWVAVMTEASTRRELANGGCEPHDPDNAMYSDLHLGCGSDVALVFFPLCYVMMNFFFLNLFISVILENFYEASEDEDAGVSEEDVVRFKNAWAFYDPAATQLMPLKGIPSLLLDIGAPLGISNDACIHNPSSLLLGGDLCVLMSELEVMIDDPKGRVHFKNLLFALMKRVLGTELPTEDLQIVRDIEEEVTRNLERKKRTSTANTSLSSSNEPITDGTTPLSPITRRLSNIKDALSSTADGSSSIEVVTDGTPDMRRFGVADTLLRHYAAYKLQRWYRHHHHKDEWALFFTRVQERIRTNAIEANLKQNSKLHKLMSMGASEATRTLPDNGSGGKGFLIRRWKTTNSPSVGKIKSRALSKKT